MINNLFHFQREEGDINDEPEVYELRKHAACLVLYSRDKHSFPGESQLCEITV